MNKDTFSLKNIQTFLPAIRIKSVAAEKRGTVILHGGFDSFIEESYSVMRCLTESECGGAHCQLNNFPLSWQIMFDWIEDIRIGLGS